MDFGFIVFILTALLFILLSAFHVYGDLEA